MARETKARMKTRWAKELSKLEGRTIARVRYTTEAEESSLGWDASAVVLELDDGTLLFPSQDDEGNDAGAMFTQAGSKTKGLSEVAPVIR